jgi:hypothetical protein
VGKAKAHSSLEEQASISRKKTIFSELERLCVPADVNNSVNKDGMPTTTGFAHTLLE